ncbi:MAG: exosortase/archaeosortase family protein [Candidatus Zixiibacteriota bacterium]
MFERTMENQVLAKRLPVWMTALPYVLLLAFYAPVLSELIWDWAHDDNYSHGFLIPLVSGYLLWKKRNELAAVAHTVDSRGLAVVILGLVLFILGNGAAEYFVVRFSFVVVLFGLTYYLFGRELVKQGWFEFFFLLFMIPIPYVIYFAATFPMQVLASKITVFVLNIIGMGVVRQGNIIHLPGYSLEVAEACSGMRSLVSLLALGALYAYMTQRGFLAKSILFLSTIPIAVIANVFRVFVTSILAYGVSNEVAEEPIHSIMGMSVFVVAFVFLFIEGFILRKLFK